MGSDDIFKKRKQGGNKSIKRWKPHKIPKNVILIVCEGKTEKNYFTSLRDFLKLTSVKIEIQHSKKTNPMGIYNSTLSDKQRNEYDEIYCVFDRDTHNDFDEALKSIEKDKKCKAIVSDPCFEFWILLHFTQTNRVFGGESPCTTLQNTREFRQNIPNYAKGTYNFQVTIQERLDTATTHAKAINQHNETQRQSPYTQVVNLVERLKQPQQF